MNYIFQFVARTIFCVQFISQEMLRTGFVILW